MHTPLSPMQASFEAWVVNQNVVKKYNAKLNKSVCGNHYKDYRINDRWVTWQAVHKQPITLPQMLKQSPHDTNANMYNHASYDCAEVLREMGYLNVTVGGGE